MSARKYAINIAMFFIILLLMLAQSQLANINPLPRVTVSKQESINSINNELISIFSLGNDRLISSILWIETLLESDLEHYDKDDLGSWMFQRFNTIVTLDPKFYEAYKFGGQYLSIIKDDEFGAKIIYDKGIKVFPNDFWLNFQAGFHYYFELGDAEQAINLYSKIVNTPEAIRRAPYLGSLIARLKTLQTGVNEDVFQVLLTSYNQEHKRSAIKQNIFFYLYSVRAELDLRCLNEKKNKDCNHRDLEGNNYMYNIETGQYSAPKEWKRLKMHKKVPLMQSGTK